MLNWWLLTNLGLLGGKLSPSLIGAPTECPGSQLLHYLLRDRCWSGRLDGGVGGREGRQYPYISSLMTCTKASSHLTIQYLFPIPKVKVGEGPISLSFFFATHIYFPIFFSCFFLHLFIEEFEMETSKVLHTATTTFFQD